MAKHWIAGAIKHPGALHKELGVPQGQKIPEKKLEKAAHAPGVEGRRARLAETLKGMHHASGGEPAKTVPAAKAPPAKPRNPEGNPGHHPSTQAYHHEGYKHTSGDR